MTIVNHCHCQYSHSLPKRFKVWVARVCLGGGGGGVYGGDMRNTGYASPQGRWAGKNGIQLATA